MSSNDEFTNRAVIATRRSFLILIFAPFVTIASLAEMQQKQQHQQAQLAASQRFKTNATAAAGSIKIYL